MRLNQIAEGIFDVSVIDWNIRDFHGYSTERGSSYNAFLIMDEKIALIDTVRSEFADQLLSHISRIIDPKKIDYVISNHTEMDHSGALPRILHRIGEDKPLVCSKMGYKNLSRHFPQKWNYQPVGSGDTLSLGKRSLRFLETRMIHWPDSMFTYSAEDRILFSSDAFGQHLATYDRFADQAGEEAVMAHAKKYYANILLLYAPRILKLLGQLRDMDLKIDMICPDHGVLWRREPERIIAAYEEWSRQEKKKKAVVIYDTMWHSTEAMADAVCQGLVSEGVAVTPMHLRKWHRSDVMTEVLDAGAVIVGSPTLNNGVFPTVMDVLTYMKGLKPINKIAAAFGSYGWSGEAVKHLNEALASMNMTLVDEGVRLAYVPDEQGLEACRELGRKVGKALA
jgi:flavorubredoxin